MIYTSASVGRHALGVSVKCFGCSLYFKSELSLLTFSFYDLSKHVLKSSIFVLSRLIRYLCSLMLYFYNIRTSALLLAYYHHFIF